MSRYSTAVSPNILDWIEHLPDGGTFRGPRLVTTTKLWQVNDSLANKSGQRHKIYWVGNKPVKEDGTMEDPPYYTKETYQGQWENNLKHGYGVQTYKHGIRRYEGQWKAGKRHGEGVLWVRVKNTRDQFRRAYTGGWEEDKKCGEGTCYYENADYYEGQWKDGKRDGKGLMRYVSGNVYQGNWKADKRQGFGIMTAANGDLYEGYWHNDLKEGSGAYYYFTTGRVLTGEWVEDYAKVGVFSKAEPAAGEAAPQEKVAAIQRRLVPIQQLKLKNPVAVLRTALEDVRNARERRLRREQNPDYQSEVDEEDLEELSQLEGSHEEGEQLQEGIDEDAEVEEYEQEGDEISVDASSSSPQKSSPADHNLKTKSTAAPQTLRIDTAFDENEHVEITTRQLRDL